MKIFPCRLLKKLFTISPRSEPMASRMTAVRVWGGNQGTRPDISAYTWSAPMRIPAVTPPTNPRMVFPSPRIRLPSVHFLPRSTGMPPPVRAAKLFGRYAGSITHIAEPMSMSPLLSIVAESGIPIRLGFRIHMSRSDIRYGNTRWW